MTVWSGTPSALPDAADGDESHATPLTSDSAVHGIAHKRTDKAAHERDRLTAIGIELAVRVGVLGLLLYWSFVLIRPFLTITIWSIVLAVALYPLYQRIVRQLGGRRRLAAVLLAILSLFVVIVPATWLVFNLIETFNTLSGQIGTSGLALPAPPERIKAWRVIGGPVYQFWSLASTNLHDAMAQLSPYLKPIGSKLLQIAADSSTAAAKFVLAIIFAGFLSYAAPSLVEALRRFSHRLAGDRGEHFVDLAGATIRAISRGVIGISALQAFLAGIGLMLAGVPAASLITSAILVLGIIQIGPGLVIILLIIWGWTAMETPAALVFTAYMIPVSLLDNILRPLLLGRGLHVPVAVILIGVIGGTISYGISGLFLGPIVLAVIWELVADWARN
jgi:predicted PurR-regulated permease PerM